jgi:hypothetical protein
MTKKNKTNIKIIFITSYTFCLSLTQSLRVCVCLSWNLLFIHISSKLILIVSDGRLTQKFMILFSSSFYHSCVRDLISFYCTKLLERSSNFTNEAIFSHSLTPMWAFIMMNIKGCKFQSFYNRLEHNVWQVCSLLLFMPFSRVFLLLVYFFSRAHTSLSHMEITVLLAFSTSINLLSLVNNFNFWTEHGVSERVREKQQQQFWIRRCLLSLRALLFLRECVLRERKEKKTLSEKKLLRVHISTLHFYVLFLSLTLAISLILISAVCYIFFFFGDISSHSNE